jgi:hypothetical protein
MIGFLMFARVGRLVAGVVEASSLRGILLVFAVLLVAMGAFAANAKLGCVVTGLVIIRALRRDR